MPRMTAPTNKHARTRIRIGEAARRSGVTIKALRFYERRRLLPRARRDGERLPRPQQTDLGRVSSIHDAVSCVASAHG